MPWHCWLGSSKGIRPVKNWAVGCWRGYLTGARCRLPYSPADATATHCLFASVKSRLVLPLWYRLTRVVPDKGPLNGCVCVCACVRACVRACARAHACMHAPKQLLLQLWLQSCVAKVHYSQGLLQPNPNCNLCTVTTHHAGWSSLPGDCCSSVECSSIVCSFCAIAAAVPPRPQDGTAYFSHRTLHHSVQLCDRL